VYWAEQPIETIGTSVSKQRNRVVLAVMVCPFLLEVVNALPIYPDPLIYRTE
jgi:hypothetical protein